MINFIEGLSCMEFLIGVAGIAGAIEQYKSIYPATVLVIISIFSILICEKIEFRKKVKHERKNYKRIY